MLDRSVKTLVRAPFQAPHYRALARVLLTFPRPFHVLRRYVTNGGSYPTTVAVRTPIGRVDLELGGPHDIRTVNEIFNRVDYPVDRNIQVVVDIGGNIGISVAYFATRNEHAVVYCFEPSPVNLPRLARNIAQFGDRVRLTRAAVATESGRLRFNAEPVGRYGGLVDLNYTRPIVDMIDVDAVEINEALRQVLDRHDRIDVLKIDTEGSEVPLVQAIDTDLLFRIGTIMIEADSRATAAIRPDQFGQRQRGSICILTPAH